VGRLALLAGALLFSHCCFAQVSAEAEIASDAVFRGVSFSGGRPALSFDVSDDGLGGWFLGSQISTVQFPAGPASAEIIAYSGVTIPIDTAYSVEFGLTGAKFSGSPSYTYYEMFVGLVAQDWTARVYLSPNYFNQGVRTLYGEINGFQETPLHFSLLEHVGMLVPSSSDPDAGRRAADIRIGVGQDFGGVHVQFAWTDVSHVAYLYPVSALSARRRWLATMSCVF
jgi:uncharacterized protein (TIGR02001 family)